MVLVSLMSIYGMSNGLLQEIQHTHRKQPTCRPDSLKCTSCIPYIGIHLLYLITFLYVFIIFVMYSVLFSLCIHYIRYVFIIFVMYSLYSLCIHYIRYVFIIFVMYSVLFSLCIQY